MAFENVHKGFGTQQVLRGIDLQIWPGVHFIMGRSGVGKSVLIKQVVGLLRPDQGRVRVDDVDVTDYDEAGFLGVRQRVQLVFQRPTLFESLSVLENVAMPYRKRFRAAAGEANEVARRALSQVGCLAVAERFPTDLGAGVCKRISMARALALKPEILLFDEPTTALDPLAARRVDALIRRLTDDHGLTSVVVSHDIISVREIADHVTFIHAGRVQFDGPQRDFLNTSDSIVAGFLASYPAFEISSASGGEGA